MNIGVLFGAGASFGAGGIAPEAPPLGHQLLDRLQTAFPETWGALLSPEEEETFRCDPPFESGMKMLWEKNDERTQRFVIDMALFFARFAPDERPNLYADFLKLIMSIRGLAFVFCSLNYECVLEQVAVSVGLNLCNLSMNKEPCVLLLKPHGSCNYIHPMTRNTFNSTFTANRYYVYHEAPNLRDIEVVPCHEVTDIYEKVGLSIPPAMSLYEASKHSPVDPGLMDLIRRKWAECAKEADVILTIGARPVLDDHHIWDAIIDSTAAVWFVGGQDSSYRKLQAQVGKRLAHIGSTLAEALSILPSRLSAASCASPDPAL